MSQLPYLCRGGSLRRRCLLRRRQRLHRPLSPQRTRSVQRRGVGHGGRGVGHGGRGGVHARPQRHGLRRGRGSRRDRGGVARYLALDQVAGFYGLPTEILRRRRHRAVRAGHRVGGRAGNGLKRCNKRASRRTREVLQARQSASNKHGQQVEYQARATRRVPSMYTSRARHQTAMRRVWGVVGRGGW